MRENKLSYIPDEIGRLSRLKVLNLSANMLQCLPYSISKLKELQALWLSENQVRSLKFKIRKYLIFLTKTKPLIQLQQEKDKTGKRFLTCYLFPQEQISRNRGKIFI